jgi:hypothetical protein
MEQAIVENAQGRETGVCCIRKAPVMPRQIIPRLHNYTPRFDAVEILMFVGGIMVVVAIALVF